MDVRPIRQNSLGEQIAAELRRLIATRRVEPGTPVAEENLAAQFGVSRGPVRDALKALNAEGLVELRGRRAVIRGLSATDIDELFSLRQMLESTALRLALSKDREALVERLDQALEEMSAAVTSGSPEAFAEADTHYHSAFYAVAGHSRLSAIWKQYLPSVSMVLLASRETYKDLTPSIESHYVLRDLIAAGEIEPVLAELTEHIDNARRRVRGYYEATTDHAPTTERPVSEQATTKVPTTAKERTS